MKTPKKILVLSLIALAPSILSAAINVGTLDDRDTKYDYVERKLSNNKTYGRYELGAGTTNDTNRTRIERDTGRFVRSAGRGFVFNAIYNIDNAGKGVYIAQVKEPDTKAPIWLIRAKNISGGKVKLYLEYVLFSEGKFSNDGREDHDIGTVAQGTDFTLKVNCGYNVANNAVFTQIWIDGEPVWSQNNPFMTKDLRFRYGSYAAANSYSKVHIRNTTYSQRN